MAMKEMIRRPPVIAISGGMRTAPMDFLPLAKKFGACKVLYKPVDLDHLLDAVRDLLDQV
jgi:DNA-binding NtrC family response regulator